MKKIYFGVDIGGTTIKFGKFSEEELLEKFEEKTPIDSNPETLISKVVDVIKSHLDNEDLIGIGIGVPGPTKNGVVLGAQNLKWKVVYVKEMLLKHFPKTQIEVLNDANAATMGEWYFGSGNKEKNAVLVTLGTGVGGGVIVDGKLVEGATGSCGEVGHIKIVYTDGRKCSCGLYGCLEQYASATGIVKTYEEVKENYKQSKLNELEVVTSKEIFDFAKEGDALGLEVVNRTSKYLATGLSAIANTLNPNVIMIGGGVSKAGDFLLEKVIKDFNDTCFYSVRGTKIVLATLRNDAGIYGCYAKLKLSNKLEKVYDVKCFTSDVLDSNCYLVQDLDTSIVIDPSSSYDEVSSFAKNKISYCLLTHGHFDHFYELKSYLNKGITFIMEPNALVKLKDEKLNLSYQFGSKLTFDLKDEKIQELHEYLSLGTIDVHVIPTNGHTNCSVTYEISDMLFTGDLIFNGSIGRTDFPTSNNLQMNCSLEILKDLNKDYFVYPGHQSSFTLQKEIKNNRYLK